MKIDYEDLSSWVSEQLESDNFEPYSSAIACVEDYENDTGICLIIVRNDKTREIRGGKKTRTIIAPLVNRKQNTGSGRSSYQNIFDRDNAVDDMISQTSAMISEYAFSDSPVPSNLQEALLARVLRAHGIGGKLVEVAVCEKMGWDEDPIIHGYDAMIPDTDRPIEIKSETATKKSGGAFKGAADWSGGTNRRSSADRIKEYDRDDTYIVMLGRDPVNGKVVYMFGVEWLKNRDYLFEQMSAGSPRLNCSQWMECKVDPLYINVERMFDNYIQRRNFRPDFAQWLINDVFNVSKEITDFVTTEFGINQNIKTPAKLKVVGE